jgi:hypothetical protein
MADGEREREAWSCGRWSHDLCRSCQVKDAYRKLVLIHHPDKKAALLGACAVAQRRSKKNCQCGPEPHSFIVSSLIHPPKKKVRWKQVRTGIRLPFGESRGTLAIAGTPCQESKSLAFQLIQEAYEYLSDPELLGGEWHGTFRSWLSH